MNINVSVVVNGDNEGKFFECRCEKEKDLNWKLYSYSEHDIKHEK
jgi:hypothetical protein